MSFLSLDCSQNDSRLIVIIAKGKRVFHVSILSLVRSGNGYASGRLSFGQASTYRPRPTYYVTVFVFLCMYVCKTLAHRMYLPMWLFHLGLLQPKPLPIQEYNKKTEGPFAISPIIHVAFSTT